MGTVLFGALAAAWALAYVVVASAAGIGGRRRAGPGAARLSMLLLAVVPAVLILTPLRRLTASAVSGAAAALGRSTVEAGRWVSELSPNDAEYVLTSVLRIGRFLFIVGVAVLLVLLYVWVLAWLCRWLRLPGVRTGTPSGTRLRWTQVDDDRAAGREMPARSFPAGQPARPCSYCADRPLAALPHLPSLLATGSFRISTAPVDLRPVPGPPRLPSRWLPSRAHEERP